MNQTSDIGAELRARRVALGMSQREIAEAVGVGQPQIARWEAGGYRGARLESVHAVARALGFALQLDGGGALPLAAESAAPYTSSVPGIEGEAERALRRLNVSALTLAAFARLHHIAQLALFGSVLTPAFCAQSDVDVLVTFDENAAPPDFATLEDLRITLEGIFRRPVDIVERRTIERADNYIRRRAILDSAREIYVAR